MYQSFEELDVWKRACQLAVRIYRCLEPCRDYGLKSQMQRAAVSIASNIAEGSERGGRDFARFLAIARGSAAELRTQLYIAGRVGVVQEQTVRECVDRTKQISRMLFALGKTLPTQRQTLKSENRKPKTERSAPPGNAVKDFFLGNWGIQDTRNMKKEPDPLGVLLITSQSERNLAHVSQETFGDWKNRQGPESSGAGASQTQQGASGRYAGLVAARGFDFLPNALAWQYQVVAQVPGLFGVVLGMVRSEAPHGCLYRG